MSREGIGVVVADHDRAFLERLQNTLLGKGLNVVAMATTGEMAVRYAADMLADALVVEFAMPDMTALEVQRQVQEKSPGTQVFVVTSNFTVDLVQRAQALGIRRVFRKDRLDFEDLAASIRSEVTRYREEMELLARQAPLAPEGTGPRGRILGLRREPQPERVRFVTQHIIFVYSPKGGVGKTTLATNLAMAFRLSPVLQTEPVVLMDFDVGFNSPIADIFELRHQRETSPFVKNLVNWRDVNPSAATREEVEDLLIRTEQGIYVLSAPPDPRYVIDASPQMAENAIQAIRKHFGLVVIDGGPKLTGFDQVALEHATLVLLVVVPQDVVSVSNAQDLRTMLEGPAAERDLSSIVRKMRLVINMMTEDARDVLNMKDIAETVGLPIMAQIPDDPAVKRAPLRKPGHVAVEAYPDAPFSLAIKRLANDIAGAYPAGFSAERPRRKKFLGIF